MVPKLGHMNCAPTPNHRERAITTAVGASYDAHLGCGSPNPGAMHCAPTTEPIVYGRQPADVGAYIVIDAGAFMTPSVAVYAQTRAQCIAPLRPNRRARATTRRCRGVIHDAHSMVWGPKPGRNELRPYDRTHQVQATFMTPI